MSTPAEILTRHHLPPEIPNTSGWCYNTFQQEVDVGSWHGTLYSLICLAELVILSVIAVAAAISKQFTPIRSKREYLVLMFGVLIWTIINAVIEIVEPIGAFDERTYSTTKEWMVFSFDVIHAFLWTTVVVFFLQHTLPENNRVVNTRTVKLALASGIVMAGIFASVKAIAVWRYPEIFDQLVFSWDSFIFLISATLVAQRLSNNIAWCPRFCHFPISRKGGYYFLTAVLLVHGCNAAGRAIVAFAVLDFGWCVLVVSDVIYTLTYPIVLIYAIRIDAKNADMINPPENNMNPELIGTVNSVAEEKPLLSVDLDYGSIVRYPYNTETALRHVQTALEIDDLLEKKSHQHPTDHVMFIQGREMREGHLMVLYPGELLLRDYLRSVYVEVTTLLDIAYAIADGMAWLSEHHHGYVHLGDDTVYIIESPASIQEDIPHVTAKVRLRYDSTDEESPVAAPKYQDDKAVIFKKELDRFLYLLRSMDPSNRVAEFQKILNKKNWKSFVAIRDALISM